MLVLNAAMGAGQAGAGGGGTTKRDDRRSSSTTDSTTQPNAERAATVDEVRAAKWHRV